MSGRSRDHSGKVSAVGEGGGVKEDKQDCLEIIVGDGASWDPGASVGLM